MANLIIPDSLIFSGNIPTSIPDLNALSVAPDIDRKAWLKSRLGKITGSMFAKVKVSASGGWTEAAESYLYDLVSEHLTGETAGQFSSNATDWGNMYEQDALDFYEKLNNVEVLKGTFFRAHQFKLVGATPDGLVGDDGVVEAKCPYSPKNHLRTVLKGIVPSEYRDQIDGHLLVTGRKWCDFISYDPRIPNENLKMKIIRVHRDESRISELRNRLEKFEAELLSHLKTLEVPLNTE